MIRTVFAVLAHAGIFTGAIAAAVGLALQLPDVQADGARLALDSAIVALWIKGTRTDGA